MISLSVATILRQASDHKAILLSPAPHAYRAILGDCVVKILERLCGGVESFRPASRLIRALVAWHAICNFFSPRTTLCPPCKDTRRKPMNPLQVSAQFAAFVWYTKRNADCSQERAAMFARTHWNRFLPLANEGLGRLL